MTKDEVLDVLTRAERPRNTRADYRSAKCVRCGYEIHAPPSRLKHVVGMHAARCSISTPEERAAFLKTGRWPRLPWSAAYRIACPLCGAKPGDNCSDVGAALHVERRRAATR